MQGPVRALRSGSQGRAPTVRAAALASVALLLQLLVTFGAPRAAHAAEPARVVRHGDGRERTVALTFDDGWDARRCREIFDTLQAHEVPATWFPNAVYTRRAPALWARIASQHQVGNHTAHHRSLPRLSDKRMRREITAGERGVETATGRPISRLMRPPYGAHDRRVRSIAGELGYGSLVLWDVDSRDSVPGADDRTVARAATRGGPGSIVLMHCGPAVTPRVLPYVIARYACAGYRFATVDGILAGVSGATARVRCPPGPLQGDGHALLADLASREWRLVDADTGDGLLPVGSDATATLRFWPRRVSGMTGCGAFDASVSVGARGSTTFGRLMREARACDDDAADGAPFDDDLSAAYLRLLLGSAGLRLEGDTLELLDAAGQARLRFQAVDPSSLAGGWIVTSIADAGDLRSVEAGTPLTVSFGAAGTLRGWAGCDAFVGGYGVRDQAITVGPVLVGPATCGDELDDRAGRYLDALRSVVSWEVADAVLQLRDADHAVVLVLVTDRAAPRDPVLAG